MGALEVANNVGVKSKLGRPDVGRQRRDGRSAESFATRSSLTFRKSISNCSRTLVYLAPPESLDERLLEIARQTVERHLKPLLRLFLCHAGA